MPKVKESPTPTAASPKKGAAKPKSLTFSQMIAARPVKFPDYTSTIHTGTDPLTVQRAKELLGWQEEPENEKWGEKFSLEDRYGKKVRLHHNLINRPIYMSSVDHLVQEIFNHRWRFNFEPIIIGKTALVLNGQHTLISLIFAEQDRLRSGDKWKERGWDGPVTIEKQINYGLEESDDIVNTMDTCKPRSIADVLYRSEFFNNLGRKERQDISKMADKAIRLLWERTGVKEHPAAWAPHLSQSEAIDFLARHPRLIRCLKHIHQENKVPKRPKDSVEKPDPRGLIARYLPTGIAAGLMYLMAATSSEDGVYFNGNPPSEKYIDWECWDKACEFWVNLKAKTLVFEPLRLALGSVHDHGVPTKIQVLIRAWIKFATDDWHTVTNASLQEGLFVTDEWGGVQLADTSTCQGIDRGKKGPKVRKPDEPDEPELSPEELEARKEAVKEKKKAERKAEAEKVAAELKARREASDKPKPEKKLTRKQQEAANREAARLADEEAAKLNGVTADEEPEEVDEEVEDSLDEEMENDLDSEDGADEVE